MADDLARTNDATPATADSDVGQSTWVNPWHTVTRWLLVINVAVFVLDYFLIRRAPVLYVDGVPVVQLPLLAMYGHFSWFLSLSQGEWWRFLTYQFCHGNLLHILVNMMGLLLAGSIVEERLGRARFLLFYLLCGAAGPVAHLVFAAMGVMSVNVFTPLVGASASIYGILVAAALVAPDEEVMLAIPPIDVKLKWVALAMVGLSLVAVLYHWENAGGHAAHIGGAAMGLLLARYVIRPRAVIPAQHMRRL
jgi:membrane associated rhomboid family serine protease